MLLLGVLLGSGVALGLSTKCKFSKEGTSFDLSHLRRPSDKGYRVFDERVGSDPLSDHQYIFNVCADVESPDDSACGSEARPAFQFQQRDGQDNICRALSGSANEGWNYSFADASRLAAGVVLTYIGGESGECEGEEHRSMSLSFLCAADWNNTFDVEPVIESYNCHYDIQLRSIWGCPSECLGKGDKPDICSGNGVCGFDWDGKRSHCYCETGWGGDLCDTKQKSGGVDPNVVEGVVLAILIILLVGVFAGVGFMVWKLRRLQIDPAAYDGLRDSFNELGQLTEM